MSDTFNAHDIYIKSADVHILIIEFPEDAANLKLEVVSEEKAFGNKNRYEEFILNCCIAQCGPFFYHVTKRPELVTRFSSIWKEVLQEVYRLNPYLDPTNLVITLDNQVKHFSTVSEKDIAIPLVENPEWELDSPAPKALEPNFNEKPVTTNLIGEKKEFNVEDLDFGKDDVDADFNFVAHKWEKMGLYLTIRKYENSQEAVVSILGGMDFDNKDAYYLLLIERCVEDWVEVIQTLDKMPSELQLDAQATAKEFYDIVTHYNPMLKLESVDFKKINRLFKEKEKERSAALSKQPLKTKIRRASKEKEKAESIQKESFAALSKEVLINLGENMRKRIIGQDAALNSVVEAVQRASVGLKREHEPLGVFMFTGNSGTGKTETAKVLSDCLTAHFVRIDCQEFQLPHEVTKLAGAAPGYIGFDAGGYLTKQITEYPFSVVLFDEIEKAHSAFHERILQIIDDGEMVDNKGNKVSFKECIMIMTSNIGVKEVESIGRTVGFGGVANLTENKSSKARSEALKKKFKPEFLNRIDEVVNFRLLEKNDYLHILDILLEEVNGQVKKSQGISLKFSAAAKNFLLDQGIDKKFGARPMRRAVKKHVNTPLAQAILAEYLEEGSKVSVGYSKTDEKLTFKPSKVVKVEEDGEVHPPRAPLGD